MTAKWTDFVSGAVLTAAQLNDVLDNFQDIAIFREEQASGTYGGTATSGSFATRTLNTTIINNITGCSLASSQVTLPAGTYRATGYAPGANGVGWQVARIQNITDGTTITQGNNGQTGSGGMTTFAFVDTVFTLAAQKAIALQMRVQTTVATDGLGNRINVAGITEVYSQLNIVRIA